MPTDDTYNGWSNRETWLIALWMDNERGSYNDRCEALDRFATAATPCILVADWLENYVKDVCPDLGATFAADLLSTALGRVNYREIADNWLSEYDGYVRMEKRS